MIKSSRSGFADVIKALKMIYRSINRNGNPRLINYAIEALVQILGDGRLHSFCDWQSALATRSYASKFQVVVWVLNPDRAGKPAARSLFKFELQGIRYFDQETLWA